MAKWRPPLWHALQAATSDDPELVDEAYQAVVEEAFRAHDHDVKEDR